MSIKILVDASTLLKLIEAHPEIELDLLRNATPQIAKFLERRATAASTSIDNQVYAAFGRLVNESATRNALPEAVRLVVRQFLRDECQATGKELVTAEAVARADMAAVKAAERALADLPKKIQAHLDVGREDLVEFIRRTAENEVLALLRAGKLTIAS